MGVYSDWLEEQKKDYATQHFAESFGSDMKPDMRAQIIEEAKELGLSPEETFRMDQNQKNKLKADRLVRSNELSAAPVYVQEAARNKVLTEITKDNPHRMGWLERQWWRLMDNDKCSHEPDDFIDQARNAVARGGFMFGGMSVARDYEKLADAYTAMKRIQNDIDAGKSNEEIFGIDNAQIAAEMRNRWDKGSQQAWAAIKQEAERIVADMQTENDLQALFPSGSGMEELSNAKGFAESAKAFLKNPSLIMETGLQSLTLFAPAMPAIALGSFFGPAGAMAVTGAYSYATDKYSTLSESLSEQIQNQKDLAAAASSILDSQLMNDIIDKAGAHAGPVAMLDALSAGIANKIFIPGGMLTRMTKGQKAWTHTLTQMPVQGLLGAAGEGFGQIAAEGEITSWADVIAEFVGEHFTAPFEIASVGARNIMLARRELTTAQTKASIMGEVVQSANDSKIAQRDPETAVAYYDAMGRESNAEVIYVDTEQLHQQGLDEALAAVSPSAAEQLREAQATGSQIAIPTGEFMTQVAPTELGAKLVPLTSVQSNKNIPQAQVRVDSVAEDTRAAITEEVAKINPDFKADLKDVTNEITGMFANATDKKEAAALTALVSSFVANRAKDLGVSPKQIWDEYGLRGVFGEDDVKMVDGKLVPVSERAKTVLSQPVQNGQSQSAADSLHQVSPERQQYVEETAEKLYDNSERKEHETIARNLASEEPRDYRGEFRQQGLSEREATVAAQNKAVLWARVHSESHRGRPAVPGRDELWDAGRNVPVKQVWTPNAGLKNIYNANGITTRDIFELEPTQENAELFQRAISNAKKNNKHGAAVYVYPVNDYKGMRLFLTDDFKAGVALKPNGDVVSLFNDKAGMGMAHSLLNIARANGGNHLDCFDTVLPKLYAPHGFRVITRQTWNNDFAPEGWEKADFAEYNNGEPDVTYMVRDDSYFGSYQGQTEGQYIDDYDETVAIQEAVNRRINGNVLHQTSQGEYLPTLRTIIKWFAGDASTLLHESGHFFLELNVALASRLAGKENLTAGERHVLESTQDALKYFAGVETIADWNAMTLEQQRTAHERFARSFEAYLYENQAPTNKIRTLFRDFSKWLKKVYSTVINIPDADISDEAKAIFDQMMVAESQVKEAEFRRTLFRHLNREDFTDESMWEAYEELRQEAHDSAIETLQAQLLKDALAIGKLKAKVLSSLQKRAKEVRSKVFDEELEKVKRDSIAQTWNLLSAGEDQDESTFSPKITRNSLVQAGVAEEIIEALDQANMLYDVNEADQTPILNGDEFAQEQGFASLSEMAQKLAEMGDPVALAERNTDARMAKEYSALNTQEAMENEADKAVVNEWAERVIHAELKALGVTTADKAMYTDMAKAWLNKQMLKNVRPKNFRNQAERLSREAWDALRKGDVETARKKKAQQLYHLCLAREAENLRKEVERGLNKARRLSKAKEIKGLNTRYLIMAQGLLADAGLTVHENLLRDRTSLSDFMNECLAEGEVPPSIDPHLEYDLRSNTQGFASLPITTLLDLFNAVDQLDHMGRAAQKVRVAGETKALSEVTDAITAQIEANAKAHGRNPVDNAASINKIKEVKRGFQRFLFAHARIAPLFAAMMGGRDNAAFDPIVRRANDAANHEWELKKEIGARVDRITKGRDFGGHEKRVYYRSVDASVTRSEAVMMLAYMGTESGLSRLLATIPQRKDIAGGRELSREQLIQLVSEALSVDDMQMVQDIWNEYERLWPQISEQQKRITGRSPKTEERTPINLVKDGRTIRLTGGYIPLTYDRKTTRKGSVLQESSNAWEALTQKRNQSAHTYSGFLKERANNVAGLTLDLTPNGLFSGFGKEIHRLAWEEACIDINKVLKAIDPTVREWYGANAADMMHRWLELNAMGDYGQTGIGDDLSKWFRKNIGVAMLGFNPITAAMQGIGIVNTIPVIGAQWTMNGVGQFLSNPNKSAAFVRSMSKFMASRADNQFREITEIQNELTGKSSGLKHALVEAAYWPIISMQLMVDYPTWLGAFAKAVSEGNTQERAAALADQAVVDSQGSGMSTHLSELERGGPWVKLMTVFYNYFGTLLNTLAVSGYTKGKLKAACDYFLICGVGFAIEQIMRDGLKAYSSGGDSDDWEKLLAEDLPTEFLKFNLSLFVGIREFQSIFDTFGYEGPTGYTKVPATTKFAQQAGKQVYKWWDEGFDAEFNEQLAKSAADFFGLFFGFPATQSKRLITGISAMQQGKTDSWLAPFIGYSELNK